MSIENRSVDANGCPLAGAAGAHPVGTDLGEAVGVVGGLAGEGVAGAVEPTRERAYWCKKFGERDCVETGSSYDNNGPAYGFAVDARHPRLGFDDFESDLSSHWAAGRGACSPSWDRAKHAARTAWNRIRPA